jgi:hypothetical protein
MTTTILLIFKIYSQVCITNSSQVADHCIIYLFSESAQKDYRKRNAATPMAMSVVGYTLDDIIEKLTEAKFLHMHVQ